MTFANDCDSPSYGGSVIAQLVGHACFERNGVPRTQVTDREGALDGQSALEYHEVVTATVPLHRLRRHRPRRVGNLYEFEVGLLSDQEAGPLHSMRKLKGPPFSSMKHERVGDEPIVGEPVDLGGVGLEEEARRHAQRFRQTEQSLDRWLDVPGLDLTQQTGGNANFGSQSPKAKALFLASLSEPDADNVRRCARRLPLGGATVGRSHDVQDSNPTAQSGWVDQRALQPDLCLGS